jgi:hypothetical protein
MMDNQFMIMQFSFACRYYEKRFALYVGERNAADDEYVIKSMVKIIADMFGADRSESKDG